MPSAASSDQPPVSTVRAGPAIRQATMALYELAKEAERFLGGCAGIRERQALDRKGTAISDLMESRDRFGEIIVTAAGEAPVAVRDVNMPDMTPGCHDALSDPALLDVHMKGIDMDLEALGADPLNQAHAFVDRVEDVALIPVHRLEHESDSVSYRERNA